MYGEDTKGIKNRFSMAIWVCFGFHIFCEAILNEQGFTASKISQHKKKQKPAKRRQKWINLEQQQHDQCDNYDFDKAEEFLAYMGYTTFTPVIRHLVDEWFFC